MACIMTQVQAMMRRTAGLMSALAAIVTPGSADTAALLEPAIQLVAALASDLAAAVEFTAGGGVLGLLAILSDSSAKVHFPSPRILLYRCIPSSSFPSTPRCAAAPALTAWHLARLHMAMVRDEELSLAVKLLLCEDMALCREETRL